MFFTMMQMLEGAARHVADASYSPYSKFKVGAAVLTKRGKIYAGTNVENASLGLTCCAERSAIFNMIANGEREIDVVMVYTPTRTPTMPCGACRQVINEFGPEAEIISICDHPERRLHFLSLDTLLPAAFGRNDLK